MPAGQALHDRRRRVPPPRRDSRRRPQRGRRRAEQGTGPVADSATRAGRLLPAGVPDGQGPVGVRDLLRRRAAPRGLAALDLPRRPAAGDAAVPALRFQRASIRVRKAFDAAAPIGADYVEAVFHGCNPFSLKREPFLSRYTGYLDLTKAGRLRLHHVQPGLQLPARSTTSWSASAPGHHGPMHCAPARQPARRAAFGRPAQVRVLPRRGRAERHDGRRLGDRSDRPEAARSRRSFRRRFSTAHLVGHLPAGHVSLRTAKLRARLRRQDRRRRAAARQRRAAGGRAVPRRLAQGAHDAGRSSTGISATARRATCPTSITSTCGRACMR